MKQIAPLFFHDGTIQLLDQTRLPFEEKWLTIETPEDMIQAIQTLAIRGAPLLGLAGLYGLYCASRHAKDYTSFLSYASSIRRARPTAINLSMVIDHALQKYSEYSDLATLTEKIDRDIRSMEESIYAESLSIAKHGDTLLKEGDCILTHCNTGSLAMLGWGTALGIIKYSYGNGKKISVFFTETRPLLQGARLTAFELSKAGIPSTLIIDSAVGFCLQEKKINLVITGADRISSNGDAANKIGTYSIAVLAKQNHIPFYISAPFSSFDFSLESGRDIPIEYRDKQEVQTNKSMWMNMPEIDCLNPAFDITPAEFITGFITEKGIISPPFR